MRTDVKLGVAFSMAIVLIAGAYYFYRDSESKPIPLSDQTVADGKRAQPATRKGESPVATDDRPATTKAPRVVRPGSAADPSKQPQVARRTPVRNAGRTPPQPNDRADATEPGITRRTPAGNAQPAAPGGAKPQVVAGRDVAGSAGGVDSPPMGSNVNVRPSDAARTAEATPIVPRRSPASAAAEGSPNVPGQAAANRRIEPGATQRGSTSPTPPDVAVDVHHVQPGDSFASLARAYYGSERLTQFLIDNNQQISDPTHLRIGMKVSIPPAPADDGITLAARAPRPGAAGRADGTVEAGRTYTVKPGDSFYVIARDVLGDATRWQELLALNTGLVNGDPTKLKPNQIVRLPRE
jgi:LysM repeat protein